MHLQNQGARPASPHRPSTPSAPDSRDPEGRGGPAPTVVAAIPARWGSTRLPGKPLRPIAGRTMIEHVYRRVQQAASLQRIVVLTDHEDIQRAVLEFGGEAEMTPEDCASGTDRIAWAARGWSEAAVVNVQGDEPLIDPDAVDRLARHLQQHPDDDLVTLAAPAQPDDIDDPNAVKVVLDRAGYALYFSRAAIPYDRDGAGDPASRPVLKHLGIYGYQRAALLRLADLEPTPLEICEKLEQLRALENGMRLKVLRVASAAPGVDTEHDLARVERLLAHSPNELTNPTS